MADKFTTEIMARQAAQARAMIEASTPEQPLTLSPALFGKLRPNQRGAFRRA